MILADGWSSGSDRQTARQVRSLVPASAVEPVGKVLSLMGAVPVFEEMKGLKHAFGHVDMNVLPAYVEEQ